MKKNPGRLISILSRKAYKHKNFHLNKYDLNAAEQPFLMALFEEDGISQETLSKYFNIDKATTARVMVSLEKKGFIIRKKDPNDKRVNLIYLTEKSYENKKHIYEVLDNWNEILTRDMTNDEKEQAYTYLCRMVSNVESYINEKGGKK